MTDADWNKWLAHHMDAFRMSLDNPADIGFLRILRSVLAPLCPTLQDMVDATNHTLLSGVHAMNNSGQASTMRAFLVQRVAERQNRSRKERQEAEINSPDATVPLHDVITKALESMRGSR